MCFPAAPGPAQTGRSGDVEGHMPKFACHVVVAPNELAIDNDANADAVRYPDVTKAIWGCRSLTAGPHLRKRKGFCRVFNIDREAGLGGQRPGDGDVPPAQGWSVGDAASLLVDNSRYDQPDPLALLFDPVNIDQPPNSF